MRINYVHLATMVNERANDQSCSEKKQNTQTHWSAPPLRFKVFYVAEDMGLQLLRQHVGCFKNNITVMTWTPPQLSK